MLRQDGPNYHSEIHYPFDALPGAGTPYEVAPGLHWLRMPLPFVLDHINLWLLDDGPGMTAPCCAL